MWSIVTADSTARDICPCDADTLFYDPPWDTMLTPLGGVERFDSILAFCDGRRIGDIVRMFGAPTWVFTWDCSSSWWTPKRPLKRGKLCVWYGDLSRWDQDGYFSPRANHRRIVKNTRGSHIAGDARGVRLSDVYQSPITALHAGDGHRHAKPLEWLQYLIACTGSTSVYDPFAGSGASVIAAKRCGIPCVGVEIDPDIAEGARVALRDFEPIQSAPMQAMLDFGQPDRERQRVIRHCADWIGDTMDD